MNFTSIKKVLILVTILTVPGFLYYLLQDHGKNRYRNLAYFGPKKALDTYRTKFGKKIRDTLYHAIPPVSLVDQLGNKINLDSIKDKVVIINLFYTKGEFAAKVSTTMARKFYDSYHRNKRISFWSVTLDPAHDQPEVLKEYADAQGAHPDKWKFLTGDTTEVNNLLKHGLFLDAVKTGEKIVYNNMMVLLDHKHHIRGYYDVSNREAMTRLDDEIKVLMAEELRNLRDGR